MDDAMTEQDYIEKIKALEKSLEDKNNYINDLENISEMHSKVIIMAEEERKEAENVIHAHENIHGVEKLYASNEDQMTHQHHQTGSFSIPINFISENGLIIDSIINELVKSYNLERAILFTKTGNKYVSEIFLNIDIEETHQEYFNIAMDSIKNVSKNKKSIIINNHQIKYKEKNAGISLTCIPVLRKGSLRGILYMDKIQY